jgi:HEAT repeat protein
VDDPRGHQALRTLIASSDTPETVNEQAIFALSQGDPTSDDVRFLEQQERRFSSEKLKDKVFFSLSQMHDDRAARWLLDVAGDENETTHARKQALFWAGQGGVSIGDLTRVYRASTNDDVKQQIIFVLSQRNEPAAIDALISIARDDSNREMRKKALFWLGQKDDPRVTKFLTDIISR